MDALLDPGTADYTGTSTDTLANAVYLRLATPLGSYWADRTLGSRLHELAREKDLANRVVLARQYAEQALEPLLADGRAQSITVQAERQGNGRIALAIAVVDAKGRVQAFTHHVEVV